MSTRQSNHLCRWTQWYQEGITAAYLKTEYQHCIVHQALHTVKYAADKDRKPFCAYLKTIYQVPTEEKALERVTERCRSETGAG